MTHDGDSTVAKAAYEAGHGGLGVDTEANAPWHLLVREHLDALPPQLLHNTQALRYGETCKSRQRQ